MLSHLVLKQACIPFPPLDQKVDPTGIEPAASRLQGEHSPAELRAHRNSRDGMSRTFVSLLSGGRQLRCRVFFR